MEYQRNDNAWAQLASYLGSGIKGQTYQESIVLPAEARHGALALRLRQTGGSGFDYDYWHVDDVCFEQQVIPVLQVAKLAQTLSDPVNGSMGSKAIPGAVVQYTVAVVNQGIGPVDADSLIVTDPLPPDTALYVSTASGNTTSFNITLRARIE